MHNKTLAWEAVRSSVTVDESEQLSKLPRNPEYYEDSSQGLRVYYDISYECFSLRSFQPDHSCYVPSIAPRERYCTVSIRQLRLLTGCRALRVLEFHGVCLAKTPIQSPRSSRETFSP